MLPKGNNTWAESRRKKGVFVKIFLGVASLLKCIASDSLLNWAHFYIITEYTKRITRKLENYGSYSINLKKTNSSISWQTL